MRDTSRGYPILASCRCAAGPWIKVDDRQSRLSKLHAHPSKCPLPGTNHTPYSLAYFAKSTESSAAFDTDRKANRSLFFHFQYQALLLLWEQHFCFQPLSALIPMDADQIWLAYWQYAEPNQVKTWALRAPHPFARLTVGF
jgi:hypothetical protein